MPSGCMYLADTISKVAFKIMHSHLTERNFALCFSCIDNFLLKIYDSYFIH